MRYDFLQPNDTFKCKNEMLNFHKGMTYSVSKVFNDNGKIRIFLSDKYGQDVEFKEYYFELTAKTVSASEARQQQSKLDYYWDNHDAPFVLNHSFHYDLEKTEFFDFENKATFCGKGYEDIIGRISRYTKSMTDEGRWRHTEIEGSKALFKTKQDFYDYFKNINLEKFAIIGMSHYSTQTDLDHMYFMLRLPQYNEKLVDLSKYQLIGVDDFYRRNKFDLNEFLELSARVIFDEDELSDANKKVIYNIIEAYELLPKSYGPTSVSKLLLGKEKKPNSTVNHLSGSCTNLKQPQLYALADIIESFMYVNNIFISKEDYSSGTEWRGDFEFIGSKMINQDELTKIKNELK